MLEVAARMAKARDLKHSPQVDELLAGFEDYLRAFDRRCPFDESKIASHRATIAIVRRAAAPTDVLEDIGWYESLLDTLEKWGMGARGASLLGLPTVRASFMAFRRDLSEIQQLRLEEIVPYHVDMIRRKVWAVLEGLKVGGQETKLVVNSKALHHLLPDLIPPIDREYTITFFFGSGTALQIQSQESKFTRMWPTFHRLAIEAMPTIQAHLGQGMHTSVPKIIDNAIVGYIKTTAAKRARVDV